MTKTTTKISPHALLREEGGEDIDKLSKQANAPFETPEQVRQRPSHRAYPQCPDDMRRLWPSNRELLRDAKAAGRKSEYDSGFWSSYFEDIGEQTDFEYERVRCVPDSLTRLH